MALLAPLTGLEPATVGLEVQRSVQLSYRGRIAVHIISYRLLTDGANTFINPNA